MFAVKTQILKNLLNDPKWSRRLYEAKTGREVTAILETYCKERGLKVAVAK